MNLRYRTQAPSIGLSQAVHPPSATASESQAMTAKTLYDKLWEMHEVTRRDDGSSLIYIDRHILHEVTSPQAFEGLRLAGRKPWRIDANIATPDHNVPTTRAERQGGLESISDEVSRLQVQTLDENCDDFGILEFKMNDTRQGIVHVVGPEQGATLPGMTVVCGDSHTSTHGAFGALAHGIGTSEVEHVLATQCLIAKKMKNMQVRVEGTLPFGVTAKDIVLAVIGKIGTAGGNGHALEFAGSAIRALSMEGRMTICNMSIEAGARVGMVAVDEKTIAYVKGRPFAPKGADWDAAVALWRTLVSDADASFDTVVELRAEDIKPQVSWGTSRRWWWQSTSRCPTRRPSRTRPNAIRSSAHSNTWACGQTSRSPRSIWTACSSAHAPTRASKTCALPRRLPKAARWPPPSSRPWWCRARDWLRHRPRPKGWTRFFWMPVSSGASPGARCVWR